MRKGFTLLELLIVIGILAILSTTMIVVINPAQLLKKARDSQRIADLSSLKTAIAYFVTETDNCSNAMGDTNHTYSDVASVSCDSRAAANSGSGDGSGYTTNGDGWIPIDFDGMTGGSPIGSLPHDPNPTSATANPGRYYVYLVGSTSDYTFQLVANMESTYYSNGGAGDVESNDGGNISTLYEIGTTNVLSTTSANCYAGTGT